MPSHRTRAQQRADEIDISPTTLLAEIDALNGRARRREPADGEEYLAALQRERAEFQNFRRRTAEERERDLGLAAEDLLRKVLTVADDFDRAIEARPAGDRRRPLGRGHRRHRSQAAAAPRERGRDRDRRRRPAGRSTRASTRRSPTCPAPAGPRARSSRRSGAAIGCATASSARRWSPSPASPTTAERRRH